MQDDTGQQPKRIGFVATRISGNDGVSLEIHKWSEVLERLGHTCFYIAGESDQPADRSQVIPEAHFKHSVIQEINRQSFGQQRRNRNLSAEIHEMTWVIKEKLHSAIDRFDLDLIIAHSSGDEGDEYSERVAKYAELMGVEVIFAAPWIAHRRGTDPQGRKQYTIWDAYQQADLITYPSTYEGFGNAFLEAVYYRKPILSNRYAIYRTDIEPCGFKAILMEGFLTDDVVDQVRRVLLDKNCCREIADHNYELGARFFSYHRVEDELRAILAKPGMSPRQEDA